MTATYTISIDPPRQLLRIAFRGFFRAEDLAEYESRKHLALVQLGLPTHQHVTLCDFTECVPQSQEVLDLFRQTLDNPRYSSRKLAVVVSTALTALQVKRIVTRPNAACFTDVAAAEAWLDGDAEPATPPAAT